MKVARRTIDIELTNRCNATCSFCPREKTPRQGFMSEAVFEQALARVAELGDAARVTLTGLGEPMLHPQFLRFTEMALARGFSVDITSNGSRLTPELTTRLLDAGLQMINFSVSDLDDDYREVYGLPFATTRDNILEFVRQSRGRCHTKVTIIKHAGNAEQLEALTRYWQEQGLDEVNVFVEDNRGGSHEMPYLFLENRRYLRESVVLLREKIGSELCGVMFHSVFIGWNGNYYLCCNDWEKTVPLGHVDALAIEEIDQAKVDFNRRQCGVCQTCNRNPVNEIREVMLDREQGRRGPFALKNKLTSLQEMHWTQVWAPQLQVGNPVIAASSD